MTTSAPGKLFLAGEWAVLAGGPAVVAAIDRRASVQIEPRPAGAPACTSRAEGRHGGLTEAGRSGDVGAVAAAWRATGSPADPVHVVVDSSAFLVGERKLGLGRSAAVLAAATAAFLARQGEHDRDVIRRTALAANRDFQGGRGSGADVAAAVAGGVVEVRAADGGDVLVTRRALPAPWRLLAGWTGDGAATVPLLDRLAGGATPPSLRALVAIARDAAAALAAGDVAGFTGTFPAATRALGALGEALGAPIVTPALARLVAAAERVGVAAKPSGAGGGDCGIALVASAGQAAALRAAWRAAGIVPLELDVDDEGVTGG